MNQALRVCLGLSCAVWRTGESVVEIDRLAPTRRPVRRAIGTQSWRDLLFMHWPVPTDALRPLIPDGLTIDTFEGVSYVGLIPFTLERLRPAGVPESLALSFLETNARTYVHFRGNDPGVFFFSLDAASAFAAITARLTFGLPYYSARIRMTREGSTIEHVTRRNRGDASLKVRYEPGTEKGRAVPGTLDHFLVERYVLYAKHLGRLLTAQIHHTPYPLSRVTIASVEETVLSSAGIARPAGLPAVAHYSSGVDVELFAPRFLRVVT